MKAVIQRVKKCTLKADNQPYSKIGNGLLVLLGVKDGDTENDAQKLVNKIINFKK